MTLCLIRPAEIGRLTDPKMAFCCKPKKSGQADCAGKTNGLRLDLEETVSEMEKRHGELANRRHYLTEKILNMEKTMPILVAQRFWNCRDKDNVSIGKIQELVDQLSPYPYPNPTEKLIKETSDKLECLDQETKRLHDTIIETDIKIEETGMELDSLVSVNNELDEKLKLFEDKALEKEKRARAFPDLHEIDPEDVACLGRIRQLVQQEIRLKNCISALDDREARLQAQLNQLLPINQTSKRSPRKGVKELFQGNREIIRRSVDYGRLKSRPETSSIRSNLCRCGSDQSLYEDISSSDDYCNCTHDNSSDEEYWECCNCEGKKLSIML